MHRLQEMKGKQHKDCHQENGAHHSQENIAANEQRVCYLLNKKRELIDNTINNTLSPVAFVLGYCPFAKETTFHQQSLLATRCQESALVSWAVIYMPKEFVNAQFKANINQQYSAYCLFIVHCCYCVLGQRFFVRNTDFPDVGLPVE